MNVLERPPLRAADIPIRRERAYWLIPGLVLLLVFAVMTAVCVGAVSISPSQLGAILMHSVGLPVWQSIDPQQEAVLLAIRLPRVCLGMLLGAGLSMAGGTMQGLFRNPLADPALLGISSGASLFAVITIMLGSSLFGGLSAWLGLYSMSLMAFAGACLTTGLVFYLSRVAGKPVVTTMLLAGIAINALANALMGLMIATATDVQLRTVTFWSLGSLGGATWEVVLVVLPLVMVPLLLLPRLAKSLNLFALGESQAAHLGVNVAVLKRQLIVLTTLVVGASVAAAGMIGFMGLLIPHLIRLIAGPDHRRLLIGSAIGGAAVLTLADTLARTLVAPAELPIGILTALLGTPVFLWILMKEKSKWG
jgi:iron complex transport system permease protein